MQLNCNVRVFLRGNYDQILHCHNSPDTHVTFNKSLTRLLEWVFAVTGSDLIKPRRSTHKLLHLHNSVLRLTFGFLLFCSLSNTFLKICINLWNLCFLKAGKFFRRKLYTLSDVSNRQFGFLFDPLPYSYKKRSLYYRTLNSSLHGLPWCSCLVSLDIVVFLPKMMIFSAFIDLVCVALVYRISWQKKKN